jgi:hypothetical protein
MTTRGEEVLDDPTPSIGMGYTNSKYVAERVSRRLYIRIAHPR